MGVAFSADPGVFQVGDAVTIRSDEVGHHHRTPWFIKGKAGVVRAISGPFLNPESRAHGGDGNPRRLLYHVEFDPVQIWGERYDEGRSDLLLVDVYEQWLEPRG